MGPFGRMIPRLRPARLRAAPADVKYKGEPENANKSHEVPPVAYF